MRGATNCRQLSAQATIPIRRLWPLFVALACLVGQAGSGFLGQESKPQATPQSKRFRLSELFSRQLPLGLTEFRVPDARSPFGESSRLALLDTSGLHIFRAEDEGMAEEFALPNPEPPPWDTLEIFPSRGQLRGVVVWASEEHSYAVGTIVCYVGGKPQVVFQGRDMDFADLDWDGIPEILVGEYSLETDAVPQFVTVWTWDGRQYVKLKRVPSAQLYSQEIAAEVRNAKKRLPER